MEVWYRVKLAGGMRGVGANAATGAEWEEVLGVESSMLELSEEDG